MSKFISEITRDFNELKTLRSSIPQIKDKGVKESIKRDISFKIKSVKDRIREEKKTLKDDPKKRAEYLKLLTVERQRGIISTADEYELNQAEYDELIKQAEKGGENCGFATNTVKMAAGWDLNLGDEVLYKSYLDEQKGENMFVLYIKVTKEPEEQIGRDLDWEIRNGYKPKREDYPPAKTLIRRRLLSETPFNIYFEKK